MPVAIGANGTLRNWKTAEFPLNFTALLQSVGESGSFDPASLRVIEVQNDNVILDENVPFQFDPDPDFNPGNKAAGTVIVMLAGQTKANSTRYFHVYFDVEGDFVPPVVTPQVVAVDGEEDEGWDSIRIDTSSAKYFYHKEGGGFSSLNDSGGNDWIDYSSAAGSAGDYRGIPNLIPPSLGGYFHPGRTGVESTLLGSGPLKARIQSRVVDAQQVVLWDLLWEIYPDYARLTVLKANTKYWFMYEGVPGGVLEVDQDYFVLSDGTGYPATADFSAAITGGEWLYFVDPALKRSLFFSHDDEDILFDRYYPMKDEMTVMGFGRQSIKPFMSAVPNHFTFGFVEQSDYTAVKRAVNAATRDWKIEISEVEIPD